MDQVMSQDILKKQTSVLLYMCNIVRELGMQAPLVLTDYLSPDAVAVIGTQLVEVQPLIWRGPWRWRWTEPEQQKEKHKRAEGRKTSRQRDTERDQVNFWVESGGPTTFPEVNTRVPLFINKSFQKYPQSLAANCSSARGVKNSTPPQTQSQPYSSQTSYAADCLESSFVSEPQEKEMREKKG